ncbi:hypothetical protein C8R43DRAFT_952696 [Mycena crocata]|nr:hypothetical protein C8R43DRAFT_952696 [Mycena crocata]
MDSLSKCTEEFGLVDPQPFDSWAAYFSQRQAAKKYASRDPADSDDEDQYVHWKAVDSAVDDVLKCTDLNAAERKIIQEGIFPLDDNVGSDGDICVRSAEVLSRIHSPTMPTAVDVQMRYWSRSRMNSVEFFCDVYYRAHNPVASAGLDISEKPEGRDMTYSFRPLALMNLADRPPGARWRRINERTFEISAVQARTLHRVLFGMPTETAPGLAGKISVREMLRLLFASVGVVLHVSSNATDKNGDNVKGGGELRWEGIQDNARWLARNIRRVAGCAPMPRDEEESEMESDAEDSERESDAEDW